MASPGPPYNDPVRAPYKTDRFYKRVYRYRPEEMMAANLFGDSVAVTTFNRGGLQAFVPFDPTEPIVCPGLEPDPEAVRRWLRERIIETVAAYENSGRLTAKELVTIRRIWLDGWSLRRLAKAEGVKPQTIRERIEGNKLGHGGLRNKALEFFAWWRFTNRRRRGVRRS